MEEEKEGGRPGGGGSVRVLWETFGGGGWNGKRSRWTGFLDVASIYDRGEDTEVLTDDGFLDVERHVF